MDEQSPLRNQQIATADLIGHVRLTRDDLARRNERIWKLGPEADLRWPHRMGQEDAPHALRRT